MNLENHKWSSQREAAEAKWSNSESGTAAILESQVTSGVVFKKSVKESEEAKRYMSIVNSMVSPTVRSRDRN